MEFLTALGQDVEIRVRPTLLDQFYQNALGLTALACRADQHHDIGGETRRAGKKSAIGRMVAIVSSFHQHCRNPSFSRKQIFAYSLRERSCLPSGLEKT
jgi:hypothetical protein